MGAAARTLLRIRMIGWWNRACARALLVGSIAAAGNAAAGVDEPVVDLLFRSSSATLPQVEIPEPSDDPAHEKRMERREKTYLTMTQPGQSH